MNYNDLTTCRVMNKYDDKLMTICTEWSDSELKLTIFSSESIPLIGKIKLSEIDIFAKNLSKTSEEYLEITRRILSGKESNESEYVLKEMKFRWKKGRWNYGIIELTEARISEVLPDLLKKFTDRDEEVEKSMEELKRENAQLKTAQSQLNDKLEDMIKLKNEMEENLYKRFIIVLNSKKEKIRELLKANEKINNSTRMNNSSDKTDEVYEADTDEEDKTEKGNGEAKSSEEEKKRKKKKNSPVRDSKKTTKVEKITSDSFLSRNLSPKEFQEEKLLRRQISDSDGQMIDSDYEEDRKSKKIRKCNGGVIKTQKKKTTTTILERNESKNAKACSSRNLEDGINKEKSSAVDIENSRRNSMDFQSSGESEDDMIFS